MESLIDTFIRSFTGYMANMLVSSRLLCQARSLSKGIYDLTILNFVITPICFKLGRYICRIGHLGSSIRR